MIALSFDTDHVNEDRMREFLARSPVPGSATFFCVQPYSCMGAPHEVCPHVVLESQDWEAPLDRAREMFPDARGFRSHGCLYSHGLTLELGQRGYAYLSAHTQFGQPEIEAYREAWGVWHLPIYYMDTLDISYSRHWPQSAHRPFSSHLLDVALGGNALYVFAFHPIHILLNTTSVDAYLSRRDAFVAGASTDEIRCEGYGVGAFYEDLVARMRAEGVGSRAMGEVATRLDDSEIPGRSA